MQLIEVKVDYLTPEKWDSVILDQNINPCRIEFYFEQDTWTLKSSTASLFLLKSHKYIMMSPCFQITGWNYCRQGNILGFQLWVKEHDLYSSLSLITAPEGRLQFCLIFCLCIWSLVLSIPIVTDLQILGWPDICIYCKREMEKGHSLTK